MNEFNFGEKFEEPMQPLVSSNITDNAGVPSEQINPTTSIEQIAGQTILTKGEFISPNFKKGSTGWMIDKDGNCEFNDGTFRGALQAESIDIPDTTTTNSFHVDSEGNTWWGATTLAGSVASVTKEGVATFTNIAISGASSTMNGSLTTYVQQRAETLWKRDFVFQGYYSDAITATLNGGTIVRTLLSSYFTAIPTNNWTYLKSTAIGQTIDGAGNIDWDDGDFEFVVSAEYKYTANQDSFLGFFVSADPTPNDNATDTLLHIGFYLAEGTMYASNANGTNQTKTDISASVTITDMNTFRFVYDTGTSIKYYINDTLVATHTTNLPSGGGDVPYLFLGIQAATSGVQEAHLVIKNNYLVIFDI